MEKKTYTISDLANEFSITTRTIRFYESRGLLSPKRNGLKRVFACRDKIRLKLALKGKRLGLSLSEIKEVIDIYDISKDEKAQADKTLLYVRKRRNKLLQQKKDIDEVCSRTTECKDHL